MLLNRSRHKVGRLALRGVERSHHDRSHQRAFTITELMVAVSLMSVIVFALYSMFNQTQRALRANEAQIDSNERGRSVLELVSREIEAARVGMRGDVTNLHLTISPWGKTVQGDLTAQQATANSFNLIPRTNAFDSVYYMTKADKGWRGRGYAILQLTNDGNIERVGPLMGSLGTLMRYETPRTNFEYGFPTTNLFKYFVENRPKPGSPPGTWPLATNFNQIADGIVHFRLKPYDPLGRPLTFNTPIYTNIQIDASNPTYRDESPFYRVYRALAGGADLGPGFSNANATNANVILRQTTPGDLTETTAAFRSNALPAYLELELGVLEPDTMRQYRQMLADGLTAQAEQYLAKRIAKVQIYRKRIPLRTVAQ